MKSGVRFIKEALFQAAQNGADIKILTGDYLFVTQPEALEELLSIHPAISIRLWNSEGRSFHPKAYIVETLENEYFFIGSSNLSASALSNGVEWNVAIENHKDVSEDALSQFLHLFYHEQTISLNTVTVEQYKNKYIDFHQKYSDLVRHWTDTEEMKMMLPIEDNLEEVEVIQENEVPYSIITPRFAQIPALEELKKTYLEGYQKAMVVMATGLGKTYLAAFFVHQFKRVLFIAHREEILVQAKNSFHHVLTGRTKGIYNGRMKEGENDCVFASVFTLSMVKHLKRFRPDEFDLIVVDEFHHAAADSYRRVIDYFHPAFLLGITATPDRNDHSDVYSICDGNLAYRIDFNEAIQNQWLAPFHYYGVYDDTDYSQIRWVGNHYDEEELLLAQLREEMADKIIENWGKYKQSRTLVFCSSIRQSDFLSAYFNQRGYRTLSLHSKQSFNRKKAISMLEKDELDAIFTVDLFNEGVDIPLVDTLLFVRPTESLTIFTQQIGRGLRLHPNKSHAVIIDLIGNYRNADIKLSIFETMAETKTKGHSIPSVPETCIVNLDVRAIDLIEEMKKKHQPRKMQLLGAYQKIKEELGRRPSYKELHLLGSIGAKPFYDEWKSYHAFLRWGEELTNHEEEVFERYESWFREVERTGMSKSYKMVMLKGMLEKGMHTWYESATPEEIAPFFHKYLTSKDYRKRIDFSDKSSQRLWEYDEKKVAKLIATMPMKKWSGSSKGLLDFNENNFRPNLEVTPEDESILFEFTREICEYRLHYFFQRRTEQNIQ